MKKNMLRLLAVCLAAVMVYSGYRVWKAYGDYRAEAKAHHAVLEYKPDPRDGEIANQSIIDLQAQYPDVIGWLTVPGTKIDYPFVRSRDNDDYLRRDLNGEYAPAGTLFMDCRCAPDLSSRNTIIYGHNMRNGSMFGTLKAFADKDFFEANPSGAIYLPHDTLALEFFAYMVVKNTDETVYSADCDGNYFEYIERSARNYRDIGLAGGDKIVTLSTCSYEFNNARMALLARAR